MGANTNPIMNNVGKTCLGVNIGCQALSLCCLNAVSVDSDQMKSSI